MRRLLLSKVSLLYKGPTIPSLVCAVPRHLAWWGGGSTRKTQRKEGLERKFGVRMQKIDSQASSYKPAGVPGGVRRGSLLLGCCSICVGAMRGTGDGTDAIKVFG